VEFVGNDPDMVYLRPAHRRRVALRLR